MVSRRTRLLQWIEAGAVAPEQIHKALAVTGVIPDGARWRRFLDQLMLALGALALVCAAVFFVAYNWDALGHFAQFAMAQALMVLALLFWWRLGTDTIAARFSLLTAAMLLGALLALYGQTYQTGADSWQLFATWAVFMLPWALIGRFAALWLMWLGLLNLSAILFFQTFRDLLWFGFNSSNDLMWLLLLLNTGAWILWELAATRLEWLANRYAIRLIAIASGSVVSLLVLLSIFGSKTPPGLAWLVFAVWLGGVYFVYRHLRPDLFMLAGACLALIVCLTALLANFMLHASDVASAFLGLALMVVAQAAAAAIWLRRIHAKQSS